MLPTIQEAEKELELAQVLNPGPWTKHSLNTGIAAHNIAEKVPGMDAEKAYIFGLLHDIGRRVGMVSGRIRCPDGMRSLPLRSTSRKRRAVPFMMCCRTLGGRHFCARPLGNRRRSRCGHSEIRTGLRKERFSQADRIG